MSNTYSWADLSWENVTEDEQVWKEIVFSGLLCWWGLWSFQSDGTLKCHEQTSHRRKDRCESSNREVDLCKKWSDILKNSIF